MGFEAASVTIGARRLGRELSVKPAFSLVMSTLGRFDEPLQFVAALSKVSAQSFEFVVVDQNEDRRLGDALQALDLSFPVKYLHCPAERGLSRGRNVGFGAAAGDIICFPDDDCIYPDWIFEAARKVFREKGVDVVCGRAADEMGRDINGRYKSRAQFVTKENVFNTQIEWVVFFKKSVLDAVGGYDECIGTGALTAWQANEGQDITLRAIGKGYSVYYDPSIYGHHPELNIIHPDGKMLKKASGYARGMGYVMGLHEYPLLQVLYHIGRSIGGMLLFLLKGRFRRAAYYAIVAVGRVEGYWGGRRAARNLSEAARFGDV